MKPLRLACILMLVAASAFAASRVTSQAAAFPVQSPCTTTALVANLHGAYRVMSVQRFGCEEDWAYLWATVGTNEQDAVGVTELMKYEGASGWFAVSRLRYCHPSVLPRAVYLLACFSN